MQVYACLSKQGVVMHTGSSVRQWRAIGGEGGVAYFCGVVLTLLAACLIPSEALGQQQTGQITGQVTDARSGAPLAQVQVYIEGTGLGGLTRADGRYTIMNAPAGAHQILAQRIGMGLETREVTVVAGESTTVDFALVPQALGLDEIVITGTAGAARRREIGNTISQINVGELAGQPLNITNMLQSAAPGLEVSMTGGEFGQAPAIRLRGNSSMAMSNNPIVYIDGVRVRSEANAHVGAVDNRGIRSSVVQTSPLNMVNPNDIERIEVIKGSAATTLYGTEASAGVIQIFTKGGSRGAPQWNLETQQGAVWSRAFGPDYAADPEECQRVGVCNFKYMRLDPYMRTGHNQYYAMSVRGGAEALQYFVSGSLSDEEGWLPNEYGDKKNIRGNFIFSPMNNLQVQWNTAYHHGWQQNISQSNAQGLTHNAYRGPDGNYFPDDLPETMQTHVLDYIIENWTDRFTTGVVLTHSAIENLTNRLTIGYDWVQQDSRNLRPFGFPGRAEGALLNHHWENRLFTLDYVGTFSFPLGSSIRSSLSWGGQAVGDEQHTVEAWGENFPGAAEPTVNSAAFSLGFEERQNVWNAGFFLQNVFDLQDKYFITVGGRVDGNSAFGEGFGLQFYPKISGSWVLSDEDFWSPELGQVRLRAAYGQSGRAPGAFDAVRTWDPAGFAGAPAFIPRNLGNPDLGPEVTTEIEAGLDGSWLDGRLSADFTYFVSTTSDALFQVRQAFSQGFGGSQLENIGKIQNRGLELALRGIPVQRASWGLDVGLNVSTLHSEVLDLGGAPPFSLGGGGWVIEGQPAPVIRGRRITNPDEPANPQFEQNHIYGPNVPTLTLTPSATLQLPRGISLSAVGEYKGGAYVRIGNTTHGGVARGGFMPLCYPYYTVPAVDRTLVPETPALWRARCTPTLTNGDYWILPIDFFRLRTLAASIPVDFAMPGQVNSATLTLALNESYTWKKNFPELDPEMRGNQGATDIVHQIDNRAPMPISFRASFRIQF